MKLYAGRVGEANISVNAPRLNSVTNKIVVSTDPTPEPSGLKLNGKYVLSGEFGAVTNKKSSFNTDVDIDGWNELPLGTRDVSGYVIAKDRFVTSSTLGVACFSDDGINWYKTSYNGSEGYQLIYYDSSREKFILPNSQSADGINWSEFQNQGRVPIVSGNNLYFTFFPTSDGFRNSIHGYKSFNTQNWYETDPYSRRIYPGYNGLNVFFESNSGKFLMSSQLGDDYTELNESGYLISEDLEEWELKQYPINVNNKYCSIKQLNNKYYCFANWGYYSGGWVHAVSQSDDGVNWSESEPLAFGGEHDFEQSSVSYVNGKFYADCNSQNKTESGYKTCVSDDGVNWSLFGYLPVRVKSDSMSRGYGMQSLAFKSGKYVLMDSTNSSKIWYSTDDMQTWTQTVSSMKVSNYNTFQSSTGLSFLLGTIVDDDYHLKLSIAYSTDNTKSFKMATVPTSDKTPNSIATSGSDYVVVGDAGTLLHSTDGIIWTQVDISNLTTGGLTNVRYINSTYYAVGDLGYVLTSSDGTTWSQSQLPIPRYE